MPTSRQTITTTNTVTDKPKGTSKVSERAKKKSWYSVLYPSYKSRSEDFKKLFKGVPDDERLVVGELFLQILVSKRLILEFRKGNKAAKSTFLLNHIEKINFARTAP